MNARVAPYVAVVVVTIGVLALVAALIVRTIGLVTGAG